MHKRLGESWRKKQGRLTQFEERQSGVWDLDIVDGEILAQLTHLCRSSCFKSGKRTLMDQDGRAVYDSMSLNRSQLLRTFGGFED